MSTKSFAVFGTGIVGQTIAGKLASLGYTVTLGTRDPAATLARNAPGAFGNPSFQAWHAANPAVSVKRYADAAASSDVVVNATSGGASLAALELAGAQHLAGKLLIDIANPLDFSRGMPPSLTVCNTDSLGEQIQRAFPDSRVVKTLNTVNAYLMVDPRQLAGGDHTMFVCGNDDAAKAETTALLQEFGWRDIVDLGDITTARGTEMMLPIWVRTWAVLKTPGFSFKLVR